MEAADAEEAFADNQEGMSVEMGYERQQLGDGWNKSKWTFKLVKII